MDLLQGYSDEEEERNSLGVEEGGDVALASSDFVEREIELPDQDDNEQIPNFDDDSSSDDDGYGPQPLKETTNPQQRTGSKEKKASIQEVSRATEVAEQEQEMSNEDRIDHYAKLKQIPIASEISLSGHEKAVTCLSIETAGNRVVTGSLDYFCKLYDFGGMDSRHRSFQSIEIDDGHPVLAISHSPSGDRFLVATSSAQPKVYDRDGNEIIKFVKGDMYLRDLSNTKGHTMEVTGVMWHPHEKNECLTSSLDGSVRVWDLLGEATFGMLINRFVLKVKPLPSNMTNSSSSSSGTSSSGGNGQSHHRLGVTSCCYNANGSRVCAGVANGSIQIWLNKRPTFSSKPDYFLIYREFVDIPVRSMAVSPNNEVLAARFDQGSVLLWDLKALPGTGTSLPITNPIKRIDNVHNFYPTANITFSPDSSLFCLCSSPNKLSTSKKSSTAVDGQPAGETETKTSNDEAAAADSGEDHRLKSRLHFFEVDPKIPPAKSETLAISILSGGGSAICVKWQPTTNQIFCSLSSGVVKVFYDATMSKKGALLSAKKAPKREKDPTDFCVVGEIYNPLALPMFRNDNPHQKTGKKVAMLKDPKIAKIPEKPTAQGPGKRENTSFFFTNYVMNGRAMDNTRLEDPREALLKMDAVAKSDPIYLGRAYQHSQPKTILADKTFEEEQEEFRKRQKTLHNPGSTSK
jgi:WD40 repeat protein